jgi:chromosome segregation ATPase
MKVFRTAMAFALAGAAAASPLTKVIELLGKLEAEIVKEGEDSAALNSEKETWCKDTSVNLGFEIKTGKAKVADLTAKIDKEAATITTLASKVEDLAAKIAKDDADLKAADKIRKEERADFEAEEAELEETVSALQRAIAVLERELSKSGGAALVQVESAGGVIQALQALVKASALNAADATKLTAFVQETEQSEDGDGEAGAPDAAAYESKAGGIVEVLEDLLDKANTQLSEARKKEESAAQNFAMLKQSLEDEMKFDTKTMEESKSASAKSSEEKATAEGDLSGTTEDLNDDEATLAEVKKDCATYADEYAAEVASRAEELKAVQAAKKALAESTGGAGDVAYGLAQVPSFLQLNRRSALSSTADLANFEAVRFVRELAKKTHSQALAQLATHMAAAVRFSAASGEDPFAKVKGLISDMLAKLESEAGEDADHKAYCDKETSDTTEKKEEKSTLIEKLSTKISQMTADSAKLKDDVATLQKELAELAATQKKMDELRRKENTLFVSSNKELTEGIAGVELALKALRDYYGGEGKAHDAKEGAAGGIIGMLEVIMADFTKGLAEITSAEDSAASEYDSTTQANKIEKTGKDQDVKYKTKEAAGLDKAVVEATADRSTTQAELDAVMEYLDKLNSMCVAKPETYAERAERRAAEIAGLKQALKILDGESLLQRKSLRH